MSKINKTSVETRLAIERRSAAMLPDRPTQAGYKPWDIRKALFSAIIADKGACIMGEIDRIVDETNAAIDAMRIKRGTLTVPMIRWKGEETIRAECVMESIYTAGCAVLFMPEDDETKEQARLARLSMAINENVDGEWSDVVVFVGEGGEIPSVDLHFRYVVMPTESEEDAVVTMVGVDAYGTGGGGTGSGVDEDAVKKIINSLLGNVENVKQYSAANPPPYPVTAVNGKTGAVTLFIPSKASDISAEEAGAVSAHNADQAAHPYLSGRVANALDRIGGHDTDIEGINTSMAERLKTADLAAKLDAYKTAQGLVGKTTTDLTNYYLKGEVYTKDEVAALISAIPKFEIKVVTSLPTANISQTTVYLVKDTTEGGGLYTEYIYVNGAWEELGNQSLDLSGYVTDEELGSLLKSYTTLTEVSELIADALKPYATDEELAEAIRVATVNLVTGAQVTTAITNALNSYYTSAQVDAQIAARISSALAPYITASKAAELYQPKGNYLTQHQSIAHLLPKNQGVANAGKLMMVAADGSVTYIDIADLGLSGGDVTGVMREGNYIDLTGDLPSGPYTLRWTGPDGKTYNAGTLTVGEMYTVTANVTNCTVSNTASVLEGNSYSATVAVSSGHVLSSITVTMGGVDITATAVNGNAIYIAEVTGNVVITAMAEVEQVNYTNLADPTSSDWLPDTRLSSGGTTGEPGKTATNYVECKSNDEIRIKGLNVTTARTALYSSKSSAPLSCSTPSFPDTNSSSYDTEMEGTDVYKFKIRLSTAKFIRFSGTLVGTDNEVIITKNEPIE